MKRFSKYNESEKDFFKKLDGLTNKPQMIPSTLN